MKMDCFSKAAIIFVLSLSSLIMKNWGAMWVSLFKRSGSVVLEILSYMLFIEIAMKLDYELIRFSPWKPVLFCFVFFCMDISVNSQTTTNFQFSLYLWLICVCSAQIVTYSVIIKMLAMMSDHKYTNFFCILLCHH